MSLEMPLIFFFRFKSKLYMKTYIKDKNKPQMYVSEFKYENNFNYAKALCIYIYLANNYPWHAVNFCGCY